MTWNVATHVATSYSSQIPHHSANDEVPKIYCNTRRATVKHHHDQLLDNCSISELMSCQAHVKKFTQSIHNMCSRACTFGSSMASPTATSCFFFSFFFFFFLFFFFFCCNSACCIIGRVCSAMDSNSMLNHQAHVSITTHDIE